MFISISQWSNKFLISYKVNKSKKSILLDMPIVYAIIFKYEILHFHI